MRLFDLEKAGRADRSLSTIRDARELVIRYAQSGKKRREYTWIPLYFIANTEANRFATQFSGRQDARSEF
jgi:hypothetical protein